MPTNNLDLTTTVTNALANITNESSVPHTPPPGNTTSQLVNNITTAIVDATTSSASTLSNTVENVVNHTVETVTQTTENIVTAFTNTTSTLNSTVSSVTNNVTQSIINHTTNSTHFATNTTQNAQNSNFEQGFISLGFVLFCALLFAFAAYVYRNYYHRHGTGRYIIVVEEESQYPRQLLGSLMDDSLSDSVFAEEETTSDSILYTNHAPSPSTTLSVSSDTLENPEEKHCTTKL